MENYVLIPYYQIDKMFILLYKMIRKELLFRYLKFQFLSVNQQVILILFQKSTSG